MQCLEEFRATCSFVTWFKARQPFWILQYALCPVRGGHVNSLTKTKSHLLLVSMVTRNGLSVSLKHVETDVVKFTSWGWLIMEQVWQKWAKWENVGQYMSSASIYDHSATRGLEGQPLQHVYMYERNQLESTREFSVYGGFEVSWAGVHKRKGQSEESLFLKIHKHWNLQNLSEVVVVIM